MKNILIGIFLLFVFVTDTYAGTTVRWRGGRTNQGTSNVDEITGMVDGDWAFVLEGSGTHPDVYIYKYTTSGDCSPAADGTKRINGPAANDCWYVSRFNIIAIVGQSDDGEHFINMSNSGDLDSDLRMDGRCWYDMAEDRIECFDGTNIKYWDPTGTQP